MSESQAHPSPQLFMETITAFHRAGALKAAIDLDLFTLIGGTPATAPDLAARCQCPLRGVRILCDSLVIFGFLTKQDSLYALTPDSAFFLDQNSRAYLGKSAQFFFAPGVSDAFQNLAATVRSGHVHTSEQGTIAPDHPVWIEFARAMGPMMVPVAHGAAALAPLAQDRDTRILDIASSHGVYGITFAQKNPRAHLVALDWEAVLAITEENARAAGLADRFSKIVGSAFDVDLGTGYDLVLVPNFLHHFNIADCTRFLTRVHAALRPGGQVVIIEFVPNEDRVTPPPAAGFSLVMLGTTPEGDAYTFSEYSKMLTAVGFKNALHERLLPTAQSAIIATA